jgi:hypothetical protein
MRSSILRAATSLRPANILRWPLSGMNGSSESASNFSTSSSIQPPITIKPAAVEQPSVVQRISHSKVTHPLPKKSETASHHPVPQSESRTESKAAKTPADVKPVKDTSVQQPKAHSDARTFPVVRSSPFFTVGEAANLKGYSSAEPLEVPKRSYSTSSYADRIFRRKKPVDRDWHLSNHQLGWAKKFCESVTPFYEFTDFKDEKYIRLGERLGDNITFSTCKNVSDNAVWFQSPSMTLNDTIAAALKSNVEAYLLDKPSQSGIIKFNDMGILCTRAPAEFIPLSELSHFEREYRLQDPTSLVDLFNIFLARRFTRNLSNVGLTVGLHSVDPEESPLFTSINVGAPPYHSPQEFDKRSIVIDFQRYFFEHKFLRTPLYNELLETTTDEFVKKLKHTPIDIFPELAGKYFDSKEKYSDKLLEESLVMGCISWYESFVSKGSQLTHSR